MPYTCLDIDTKSSWVKLFNYFNACYLFGTENVVIDETKKGYHMKITVNITPEETLDIREHFLGIDLGRLMYDRVRLLAGKVYLTNTLFIRKGKHLKEVAINPLSLPFKNSRMPSLRGKRRVD